MSLGVPRAVGVSTKRCTLEATGRAQIDALSKVVDKILCDHLFISAFWV